MEENPNTIETTIMAALSTLTPSDLSDLTHSISTLLHLHHRRLSAILSSPTLFSLTLHHLHSLSLRRKSLLIARHLLSTLSPLTRYLQPRTTARPPPSSAVNLRDLDAVLLLLLLCEIRQHDPRALETLSPIEWRIDLSKYVSDSMLTLSNAAVSSSAVLIQYVEVIAKCRRFVGVMGYVGAKEGRETAASAAAVVALPSVELRGSAERECVICKEEMRQGRDVCQLPCDHLFHWMCILPWLKKRSTCPFCRYRLPTDDISGEIDRLWAVVIKVGGSNVIPEFGDPLEQRVRCT